MCAGNAHLIQSLDANRAPVASTPPAVFSTSVPFSVARGRESVQVRGRILSGAMFLVDASVWWKISVTGRRESDERPRCTHGHLDQARHTDRRGDQRFAGRGSARFQCAAHRAGRRARPVGGTITASPTSISRPSTSASPVSSIETSWNVLHRNTSDPRDVPSEDFTHLGA